MSEFIFSAIINNVSDKGEGVGRSMFAKKTETTEQRKVCQFFESLSNSIFSAKS